MTTPEIPSNYRPDISCAFRRDTLAPPTDQITYTDSLPKEASLFFDHEGALWKAFYETDDPLIAESLARRLATGYLIATALRLNDSTAVLPEKELNQANKRFTEASVEMYGGVDRDTALGLVHERVAYYEAVRENLNLYPDLDENILDSVIATYKSALPDEVTDRTETTNINEVAMSVASKLKPVYDMLLAPVLEELERQPPQDTYSPTDIIRLLNHIKPKLIQLYPGLADWDIIVEPGTISFDSKGKNKVLRVGSQNRHLPLHKVKGKLAHELTVHTLRSLYGELLEDELSQYGYPNFLTSEEGLACLAQLAYEGEVPAVRTERYIDYALAMNIIGDKPLSLTEIKEFYKQRKYIEGIVENKPFTSADLERQSTKYAHRMFKGTQGKEYASTVAPAVNTQDLAYSIGFVAATKAISDRLSRGIDPHIILISLLAGGKYDFTNPAHNARAEKVAKDKLPKNLTDRLIFTD